MMTTQRSGTPPVVVIDAGVRDVDALAVLHAVCFDETWDRDVFARLLGSAGVFGLLARRAGRPIGFVICRMAADECELLSIGVVPADRRNGIGRELLGVALARASLARAASLYLEVAEDNPAARALYDAAGFEPVSRRPDYYRRSADDPVAAIVLRREITSYALRRRNR